jgi:hypothetical protein
MEDAAGNPANVGELNHLRTVKMTEIGPAGNKAS